MNTFTSNEKPNRSALTPTSTDLIPRFTLSFDFEIGWGDVTNGLWRQREIRGTYKKLRNVLPKLLKEMEALEFPATWASVGGMITGLDKIEIDHLPKGARDVVKSTLDTGLSSSFDGRDLFEMVLAHQATGHKIACHSYSHVPFDYEGMSGKVVLADLALAQAAYSMYGINTDVFVYPENTEKYQDELRASGYKIVRTSANVDMRNRLMYLVGALTAAPPFAKESYLDSGLLEQSGSMLFNMGVGKAYRMPFVYRRAIAGLKCLVRTESELLHIWTHPFNFAESEFLYKTFVSYLRRVAKERDKGNLNIVTM